MKFEINLIHPKCSCKENLYKKGTSVFSTFVTDIVDVDLGQLTSSLTYDIVDVDLVQLTSSLTTVVNVENTEKIKNH